MRVFQIASLLIALTAADALPEQSVYVGVLREASPAHLELRRGETTLSVGFVGDAEVLEALKRVEVGEEVRAVFGTVIPTGQIRPTNKLLEIRRCEQDDRECAADKEAEAERNLIEKTRTDESDEVRAQCFRAMDETLAKDPRHVPATDSDPPGSETIVDRFNSLTGKRKHCARKILDDDQASTLEACTLHQCGEGIGGGCAHIASFLSEAAMEHAVQVCKSK